MTFKEAGTILGVVALLVGAGVTFQQVSSKADEAVKESENTRSVHRADMDRLEAQAAKIGQYIEESEIRRRVDIARDRALCAAERSDPIYCQSRGYAFGTD